MMVLITGGTGTVGSRTMARLLDRGAAVCCLTRSLEKSAALPEGVRGGVGDLLQPETLPAAFEGVDAVFLIAPLHPDETTMGLNGVQAAKKAGVKKIVYLSVPIPEDSRHIPHFVSKVPIEDAIKASGIPYTILRPNNFFQNDLALQQAVMEYGVYPQPLGSKGLNRIDVRDIADAAANALTLPQHDGQDYELHGPDVLTGPDSAALFSRFLGRQIHYGGDDLDAWEQQTRPFLPGWMVDDLRLMFQYFQDHGFRAGPSALERQRAVVGHAPRRYEDFVQETAAAWAG